MKSAIQSILRLAQAVLLMLGGTAAQAHVTLEQAQAPAGAYYKAVLRVGHGCAGSAIRALTVLLPAGVSKAKPMPMPGWALEIQLQNPAAAAQEVAEITWRANSPADYLADAHYGEFVMRLRLPEKPGSIWFKVVQICETGQIDWVQLPSAGNSTRALKTPAALLEIRPADAARHHH